MTFISERTFPRNAADNYRSVPIRPVDASKVKVGEQYLLCQTGYVIGSISGHTDLWTVDKIGRKWVWMKRTLGSGFVERGWKVPVRHDPEVSTRELAAYV